LIQLSKAEARLLTGPHFVSVCRRRVHRRLTGVAGIVVIGTVTVANVVVGISGIATREISSDAIAPLGASAR